jgi:hypothetical protein
VAGHSTSSQMQQAPEQARPRLSARAPSLRTAVIIFIGLLILFRWLHLILALQLASTGRQIQIATEELQRIERHNMTLVRDISEAESPASLSDRATQAGYGPVQPIYVHTDQPLARPPAGAEILSAIEQDQAALPPGAASLAPWDVPGAEMDGRVRLDTAP